MTTIGEQTRLFAAPGAVDPAAIAGLTFSLSPRLYVLEIEVLESGLEWKLQLEHSGPDEVHLFTWVVATTQPKPKNHGSLCDHQRS